MWTYFPMHSLFLIHTVKKWSNAYYFHFASMKFRTRELSLGMHLPLLPLGLPSSMAHHTQTYLRDAISAHSRFPSPLWKSDPSTKIPAINKQKLLQKLCSAVLEPIGKEQWINVLIWVSLVDKYYTRLYKDLIILFERQSSREREMEVFHLLVHSLGGCKGLGWGQRGFRSQELQWGLCEWQWPKYLGHLALLFPGH